MSANPLPAVTDRPTFCVNHEQIVLESSESFEFIDVTPRITEIVRRAGLANGIVNIQTRHTTTAVVINENEPLLIRDIESRLRLWAPEWAHYRHDDLNERTVNLTDTERANGHAHARAIVLGTSESVNVQGGLLMLGRWQRIFLVELDGAQERRLSITTLGERHAEPPARAGAPPHLRARAEWEKAASRCG